MKTGLVVGRTLDRYVIERPLGHGGMASVVQVRHTVLGTVHAMKVLHVSTERLQDRLLREGRVQAALRHPNLVAVTDVVSLELGVALILEYVEGPTLSELLRLFRPTLDELDALAEQVMQGVEAAHAMGVVHRDLKPSNVLVSLRGDELVARITDFGLARALADGLPAGAPLTNSGVPMGTPGYMAPEQHRNARDVDARADLFSLGVLLYELTTGRPPFDGWDMISVYEQIMDKRYLPLDAVCPDVPPRVERAIRAALAPDPVDRPESVAALRALWREGRSDRPERWSPEHLHAVRRWISEREAMRLDQEQTDSEASASPAGATDPALAPLTFLDAPGALAPLTTTGPPSPDGLTPAPAPAPLSDRTRAGLLGTLLLLGVAMAVAVAVSARESAIRRAKEMEEVARAELLQSAVPPTQPAEPPAEEPAAALAPVEPTPAAEAPAEPPRSTRGSSTARVTVLGVTDALLVDAEGQQRDPSSPVPPGDYRLMIRDARGTYVPVLRRTLRAGQRVRIRCEVDMMVCREE